MNKRIRRKHGLFTKREINRMTKTWGEFERRYVASVASFAGIERWFDIQPTFKISFKEIHAEREANADKNPCKVWEI